VTQARDKRVTNRSLVKLDSDQVLITGLKASDDGHALIVRLFNAGDKQESVRLNWGDLQPKSLWLSDTAEENLREVGNKLDVPAHDLLTVRAELP
jgi:hypothetical protein